jgi:hypothetical protein
MGVSLVATERSAIMIRFLARTAAVSGDTGVGGSDDHRNQCKETVNYSIE